MKSLRITIAFLLLTLAVQCGHSAEKAKPAVKAPVVAGATEVEQYKLVRLTVANCDSAIWFIEPAEFVDIETSTDGKSVVWTGPPREYTVHTVTLTAGKLGQLRSKVTIKGGGEDDSVNPPNPGPEPTPKPGVRHVILIEESSERTPELAKLITSSSFRNYLSQSKHQWWLVDKDSAAPANLVTWVQRAGGNVPRMFITDNAGKLLYEGAPPKEAEAIALVKKHGG